MSKLNTLLEKLIPNLFNTVISLGAIAFCCYLLYYFVSKDSDSKKAKIIIKQRILYIMLVIDVFVAAKIWIDGFTHIFTMMSLVAAGIVITNKESIMNLVGGLIIYWRALFVEGDFIQIQTFTGYVSSIGILYFRIYETLSIDQGQATGRTIKIPNSLVITSPVINFSPESNLFLYKILCNLDKKIPLEQQMNGVKQVITEILDEIYADNIHYNAAYLKSHNRDLASLIELRPDVELVSPSDDCSDLKIVAKFYCFSRDYTRISQQFWLKMPLL